MSDEGPVTVPERQPSRNLCLRCELRAAPSRDASEARAHGLGTSALLFRQTKVTPVLETVLKQKV